MRPAGTVVQQLYHGNIVESEFSGVGRSKMCFSNCMFVTASLLLTLTFVAVGVSFFGPYWMSNLGSRAAVNETQFADPPNKPYLPYNKTVWQHPDRGLWAQCGLSCIWFWTDGMYLQSHLFSPLQWHLSTQVLYFVAAFIILFSELFARIQMCCSDERNSRNYAIVGILVLVSALLQTGAVAAFGAGAAKEPYHVITDPTKFTQYLGEAFDPQSNPVYAPYLGWCFWMAVVGDMLSVLSGMLFLLAAWCNCCDKEMD